MIGDIPAVGTAIRFREAHTAEFHNVRPGDPVYVARHDPTTIWWSYASGGALGDSVSREVFWGVFELHAKRFLVKANFDIGAQVHGFNTRAEAVSYAMHTKGIEGYQILDTDSNEIIEEDER